MILSVVALGVIALVSWLLDKEDEPDIPQFLQDALDKESNDRN